METGELGLEPGTDNGCGWPKQRSNQMLAPLTVKRHVIKIMEADLKQALFLAKGL